LQPQGFALVAAALALAIFAAVPVSCGSSNGTGGGGGAGGGMAGGGVGGFGGQKTPKNSCIQPGDKGNNIGVGTYCSPAGKQCQNFPLAGLCLADVGQDQWFCSKIGCTKSSECGNDATCVIHSDGSACVPNHCLDGSSTGSGGAGGTSGSGGSGGSSSGGSSAGGSPGSGGTGGTPTP
jgi:hypothetical protein